MKCKICNKEIKKTSKIYCSNKCKFSDPEYNKSRSSKIKNIEKNKVVKCKMCDKIYDDYNNISGALTRHLKNMHDIIGTNTLEYFDHQFKVMRDKFKCPLCDWSTVDLDNKSGWFTLHLKKKHNLTPEQYVQKFPEHKGLWKVYFIRKERDDFIKLENENRIKCQICGEYFKKLSNSHLKKHDITPNQYKQEFDIISTTPISTSKLQSQITSQSNMEIGSFLPNKQSQDEKKFIEMLNNKGIKTISPFILNGKRFDIFVPEYDTIIEIDGSVYHKNKLVNLTLQTVNTAINDFQKK